jgi:hypothetical protein
MTTPKQRRHRGKSELSITEMEQHAFASSVLLDHEFDEASQADREFVRWRFPERDDG